MKKLSENFFNFPIKTFEPEDLLNELMNANDGSVFIVGEKIIKNHEGDDSVELTMVQVKKTRS